MVPLVTRETTSQFGLAEVFAGESYFTGAYHCELRHLHYVSTAAIGIDLE